MQPDAPPAPPPAPMGNGQSNYDFIFNPNQPGKKPIIPGGNTKKGRMIIIAIGAVFLIVVSLIIVGLVNNAGKADTASLISAAKQQQELIRIAKIGQDKAKGQDAKNIAVTTLLALESEQDDMQTAISAAGLKPKNVLAGSENSKTDEAFTIAEQTNRFDEEFIKVMNTSLTNYQKSVKAAYDGATSKKLKTALSTQFISANTLAGVTSSTSQ